eukprot:2392722-Pyramimonas_sp.AAC.1
MPRGDAVTLTWPASHRPRGRDTIVCTWKHFFAVSQHLRAGFAPQDLWGLSGNAASRDGLQ